MERSTGPAGRLHFDETALAAVTPRIRWRLYTSHFSSTWNARLFEFGAYLFLAKIYPGTLLPASVYALSRAGAAAFLSNIVGRLIDNGDRLTVIRTSIVGQRISVALSCLLLLALTSFLFLKTHALYSGVTLAMLCFLAAVEKLSSVLNTIAVERDWVVVIAAGHEEDLQQLNAQMRRIDLFCKLIGPLVIAFIDSASSRIAILSTITTTLLSVTIEYWTIASVYRSVPALQTPPDATANAEGMRNQSACFQQLNTYVRHPVFLPSFALALLYLTVLSFNGQLITYLLSPPTALPSVTIGILRGVSACAELSATWLAPFLMSRIGPLRSGIWLLNSQFICILLACAFLFLPLSQQGGALSTVGLLAAVVLSRVGLWGFDLSAQTLIQSEVEPHLRGSFSSTEFAFQNFFEMLAFGTTVAFARPDDFRWPALISATAVGTAGASYAWFVRARRGHLVHFERCGCGIGEKGRGVWTRLGQEEEMGLELEDERRPRP